MRVKQSLDNHAAIYLLLLNCVDLLIIDNLSLDKYFVLFYFFSLGFLAWWCRRSFVIVVVRGLLSCLAKTFFLKPVLAILWIGFSFFGLENFGFPLLAFAAVCGFSAFRFFNELLWPLRKDCLRDDAIFLSEKEHKCIASSFEYLYEKNWYFRNHHSHPNTLTTSSYQPCLQGTISMRITGEQSFTINLKLENKFADAN